MTSQDNLIWWHRPRNTQHYTKLFESNPQGSTVKADFVEIVGTFDILVKNVQLEHGGEFVCQLVSMQNYTARLTVAGKMHLNSPKLLEFIHSMYIFAFIIVT